MLIISLLQHKLRGPKRPLGKKGKLRGEGPPLRKKILVHSRRLGGVLGDEGKRKKKR